MQEKISQLVDRMEKGLQLYKKGMDFFKDNDFEVAEEYFKKSLSIYEDYKSYRMLSKIYDKRQDYENKFLYIKKSYETSDIQDPVAKEYAEMLIERNLLDEAEIILNKTLLRNKTYKPAQQLLKIIDDRRNNHMMNK